MEERVPFLETMSEPAPLLDHETRLGAGASSLVKRTENQRVRQTHSSSHSLKQYSLAQTNKLRGMSLCISIDTYISLQNYCSVIYPRC